MANTKDMRKLQATIFALDQLNNIFSKNKQGNQQMYGSPFVPSYKNQEAYQKQQSKQDDLIVKQLLNQGYEFTPIPSKEEEFRRYQKGAAPTKGYIYNNMLLKAPDPYSSKVPQHAQMFADALGVKLGNEPIKDFNSAGYNVSVSSEGKWSLTPRPESKGKESKTQQEYKETEQYAPDFSELTPNEITGMYDVNSGEALILKKIQTDSDMAAFLGEYDENEEEFKTKYIDKNKIKKAYDTRSRKVNRRKLLAGE